MVPSLDTYWYKKSISSFELFWGYWNFMNSVIWNDLLLLWIYIKSYLKQIYYFEGLWASPALAEQAQLIISMDIYPHKKNPNFTAILQLDQSRRSLTIKPNLITLSDMVIGMGSQVWQ